jgi:hybrid cluster-associated redox disulfide protein
MAEKISKGMTLGEVISNFPDAVPTMVNYGLHCVGCHVAAYETVEQGAKAHGMTDADIDKMLKEMNKAAEKD